MNIQISCHKIVLLKFTNREEIQFYPDLETAFPDFGDAVVVPCLSMDVKRGYGREYLKRTFGVEPTKVITVD